MDEEWQTAFAIIRGNLHGLGLSLQSHEVRSWIETAHSKALTSGLVPPVNRPTIADLPLPAVKAFASATTRKLYESWQASATPAPVKAASEPKVVDPVTLSQYRTWWKDAESEEVKTYIKSIAPPEILELLAA